MSDTAAPPALKLFSFNQGTITGLSDEGNAEHFAADYQGLRHFAEKVGSALDLGPAWMSGLREIDYTLVWSLSPEGDAGQGAMIESPAPLFEMLQHVSPES